MLEIVEVRESFGERVARLRQDRGLKPHELAQRVGVAEGTIRKIEKGETQNATFPSGLLMARALGCDPWFLAFGQDGPPADVAGEASLTVAKMARDLAELRSAFEEYIRKFPATGFPDGERASEE